MKRRDRPFSGIPAEQMSLFVAGGGSVGDPAGVAGEHPPRPAMWQVHGRYLFIETRSGLVIVDQHAAHQRVLYEQIMHVEEYGEPERQRLLFPITLSLAPEEYAVVEELSGLLARVGFELELTGEGELVVHAAPSPTPSFDAERCLREMIGDLTHGSPLIDAARNQHQRVALSFASRAAIHEGQRLSEQEMADLFDQLFATEHPYEDLQGRPTLIQLPIEELRNRFGR